MKILNNTNIKTTKNLNLDSKIPGELKRLKTLRTDST